MSETDANKNEYFGERKALNGSITDKKNRWREKKRYKVFWRLGNESANVISTICHTLSCMEILLFAWFINIAVSFAGKFGIVYILTYAVRSGRPIEKEKKKCYEKKKMGRLKAFIWGNGKRKKRN